VIVFVLGELEKENMQLRKLLRTMDSIGRKNAGDVGTEKHHKEEIEQQKLLDAEEQLSIMVR
jgi:hypothetical protein